MQLDSHCPCSKGLSYDAKRDKMLELFHETSEVYNFKELEKLGPKKGVISQAVKEIIASLVADGLVTSEYVLSLTTCLDPHYRPENWALASTTGPSQANPAPI